MQSVENSVKYTTRKRMMIYFAITNDIKRLFERLKMDYISIAEVAYSRGEIDKVYESAKYLPNKHSGFYAVQSAGMLLAMCAVRKTVMSEIDLRLTCAAVYHSNGNDKEVIRHIDRALSLALPDRFYGVLAEYCRTIGTLIEARLKLIDENAYNEVKTSVRHLL